MAEERNQSPHYIPELDPQRSKFDWNSFSDYYFGLAYLVTSGGCAFWFFANDERMLGFLIIGFGVAMIALSAWLRVRENHKDLERLTVGENDRDQGPHYIAELDPASAKHKKGFADPLIWVSIIFSIIFVAGAVFAWQSGMAAPAKFVTAASIVSFSPPLIVASDGLIAGTA